MDLDEWLNASKAKRWSVSSGDLHNLIDIAADQRDQARAERDACAAALVDIYAQASICDGENAKLRHEWVRERCRAAHAQLPHAAERARLVDAEKEDKDGK